tara:strand:- start:215 stop:601 length:387 start_codon:yes stop_codon:yes gene_type:complete
MKKLWIIPLVLVFIILGFFLTVYFFMFYTNVTTTGSKFGFDIGMTKDEAIQVIYERYYDSRVVLAPGYSPRPVNEVLWIDADSLTSEQVVGKDIWTININQKNTNSIKIFFVDDHISKMHRYRRFFIP